MSMEMVLITGMSGSGKTVALHVLEDAGYFCVDNLPPELLLPLVALERKKNARRLAIAMDVRSSSSLVQVPALLANMRHQGIDVKFLFLDASTDALVRRFSETRRRHPLSQIDPGAAHDDLSRAPVITRIPDVAEFLEPKCEKDLSLVILIEVEAIRFQDLWLLRVRFQTLQ